MQPKTHACFAGSTMDNKNCDKSGKFFLKVGLTSFKSVPNQFVSSKFAADNFVDVSTTLLMFLTLFVDASVTDNQF